MVYNKQKKTHKSKINKFLVSISFIGSAGPIRFVVKEDETVSHVIEQLPLLGSDSSYFLLYCPYCAAEAFNPCGKIGSIGSRNLVLSKKSDISGRWKAWLNKSLGLMDPSH
ncbi:hypothetical protein Bca52824_059037 [Brassica carinata]|uniref:DUF7054 domain-containing protein n=1 Tax=Brassica carinata TaxID=52824 RepID=A0A8X7UF60_BRACI|nr:hypothetical protein Bca52824_059037 [Brassica carinata]